MASVPRVSVLTPAFRHAALIRDAIASVQAQTLEDWEMIVVDDGSDDGTADAAEAVGDPRVRVLRESHRGIERLFETKNIALREARAPLVAILEGDDLWKPEKLAIQIPDFDEEAVVLSAGRYETAGLDLSQATLAPKPDVPDAAWRNDPVGTAGFHMLRPMTLTFTWPVTVMMRRAALEAAGGFQQPVGLCTIDYPTFLAMSLQGEWRFHEEVLGVWRRHAASVTSSRLPTILDGAHRLASRFAVRNREALGIDQPRRDQLRREWADFSMHRLTVLGRMKADAGDFGAATEAFRVAERFAHKAASKLLLRFALGACRKNRSPEPWFRRAGKPTWRDQLMISGTDPIVDPDTDPSTFQDLPF